MMMSDMLTELGFHVIGPFGRVADAMAADGLHRSWSCKSRSKDKCSRAYLLMAANSSGNIKRCSPRREVNQRRTSMYRSRQGSWRATFDKPRVLAGPPNHDDLALLSDEIAASQIAHESFIDRRLLVREV